LPDGPLNSVSFAALPISTRSQRLIVERLVVSNAPSLVLALQPRSDWHDVPTGVAIVFDPVYTADDRRFGTQRSTESHGQLKRLRYSATEARAVAAALDTSDVAELSGFDANAVRVAELASRNLRILHFATHAVARPDEPDQSALFLSEYAADRTALAADRFTADDIAHSGLRADLVVLSGCSTGNGRELNGEGVLGLAHQFLANGSNTVVASLWPVEDALTARFMEEFYTAYRATGRAPDALRAAQLRTRGTAAAAVWASFVVRANSLP